LVDGLARWNAFREVAPFASFPEVEAYFSEFRFRH
jgi:hypothetical protein